MAEPTSLLDILQVAPDRYLTCQKCSVRFVWTGWEQRQQVAEPEQCPGCRQLLTLTRRQRGTVKWYDRRKGFGFITASDGSEVFVHRRSLTRATVLRRGQVVAFRVEPGDHGPQTADVELMDAAASGAEHPVAEADPTL